VTLESENFRKYTMPQKKPQLITSPEMDWLNANDALLQENYVGKWIAIKGGELVGVGDTLGEAMEQAEERGFRVPLVTFVRKRDPNTILIRRLL
jgi:hypothetical protein